MSRLKWGASREAWGPRPAPFSSTAPPQSHPESFFSGLCACGIPTSTKPCMSFINISFSSSSKVPDARMPVWPSPALGRQSVPGPGQWGGYGHDHPHLAPDPHPALTAASAQGAATPPWETGIAVNLAEEEGSLVPPVRRPRVGPRGWVDCFWQRHPGGLLGGARPSQGALQAGKCCVSLWPAINGCGSPGSRKEPHTDHRRAGSTAVTGPSGLIHPHGGESPPDTCAVSNEALSRPGKLLLAPGSLTGVLRATAGSLGSPRANRSD